MPAQSKSQQRFFGVVKAMQKGDIPKKGKAGKIAKSMSKDDVDDFASTKHKGKPEKVKREQRVRELIKKMVREELDERMKTGPLTPKQSKEAGSMKNYLKKNNPFSEEDLEETTVRISTMKDVSFAGRDRLQLVGKKGKIGLDRKSVSALAKAVRMALGRSFITHEEKLNEAKTITLPNGVKAKIEFKGITLQKSGKKPVFLDRTEMMKFFQATQKYMKQGLTAGKMSEAKIKPKQKISKKEWSKIKKFNKHIGQDGTHYVVQLNKKLGTILVPVIVEGKLTEKIGKGISFDMLKLGNTVKYTMGMDYKVVKLSSSKATLQLINTLKNVNKSMFAKKFDISKRDFDNAILDRQIRFITRGSAKVNEGTCGYGENGELGEEPAGPHLIKKKKIKESGRNIAKTILQQLGGNKFIAMTGAKNLGFTNNGLQMKIGRNSKGITHVIISLKSTDTYDVEFIKMRGVNRKVVKKLKGVYADQLGKIFTKFTGLRTRL